jgi:hypothetical protein
LHLIGFSLYICSSKLHAMKKSLKRLVILTVLFSVVNIAMADRGGKKKATKPQVALNIAIVPGAFRTSIPFNFSSGLFYSGSFFTSQKVVGNSFMNNAIVTYEKGNTIYIIPYKQQKIQMPDYKAGFGIRIQFH